MKILVGSTNPVKIAATQAVFSRLHPDSSVAGLNVPSGVPDQPWGDPQTRTGAINRARVALAPGADFGVGFEGGLVETELGLMTCAWCAVAGEGGRIGVGGGVNVLLPESIHTMLYTGNELGSAMDLLIGAEGTKQGPGAVGILTAGLTDRQQAYMHMLALALAPFRRPDLYRQDRR
jgi:inosine/xanthosine triphosphatase